MHLLCASESWPCGSRQFLMLWGSHTLPALPAQCELVVCSLMLWLMGGTSLAARFRAAAAACQAPAWRPRWWQGQSACWPAWCQRSTGKGKGACSAFTKHSILMDERAQYHGQPASDLIMTSVWSARNLWYLLNAFGQQLAVFKSSAAACLQTAGRASAAVVTCPAKLALQLALLYCIC